MQNRQENKRVLSYALQQSINECSTEPKMIEECLLNNPLAEALMTEILKVQEENFKMQLEHKIRQQ